MRDTLPEFMVEPDWNPARCATVGFGFNPEQQQKGKTMTVNYRVAYTFVQLPDAALAEFSTNIINSLTGNAGFPQNGKGT
mgnify:CR=1 FL=1